MIGADGDLFLPGLLVEVDRVGGARRDARPAVGTHGAVQAALGLGHRLVRGVAGTDLAPVLAPREAVERPDRHPLPDLDPRELLVRGLGDVGVVVPDRQQRLAAEVVVDGRRAPAARGDGLDGGVVTHGRRVPTREDTLSRGHHRVAVDADLAVAQVETGAPLREVVDERLADGEHDGVGLQLELGPGDRRRLAATRLVRCAQLAALQLDAGDSTGVAEDLDRLHQELDPDAFLACFLDLARVGRHLDLAAAIGEGDVGVQPGLPLQTDDGAGRVQRHVASADDHCTGADRRRAAEVDLTQKLDRTAHAGESVPGQPDPGTSLQAGGEVDGCVALLEQIIHREVDAGALAESELDAPGQHLVDLALDHVVRQAIVGNAEAQHAAGYLLRLVHDDLVAEIGQVAGAGRAGRAGTDHGHSLLVGAPVSVRRSWPGRRCRRRSA